MIIQSSSVTAGILILNEIYSELMKISLIRITKTLKKKENNLNVTINSVFLISENIIIRRMQNLEYELE
jgi:hypothetical protein